MCISDEEDFDSSICRYDFSGGKSIYKKIAFSFAASRNL